MKTNPSDELRKKLEERMYLVCQKLHENEHIGDDCMCTSEIAPAYRFLLEAIDAYTKPLIQQQTAAAREATHKLYDKELEMHRNFMANVLARENLKTNTTLTICDLCSAKLQATDLSGEHETSKKASTVAPLRGEGKIE